MALRKPALAAGGLWAALAADIATIVGLAEPAQLAQADMLRLMPP